MPLKQSNGFRPRRFELWRLPLAILAGLVIGIWAGHTVLAKLPATYAIVQGLSMVPTFQPGSSIVTVPATAPLRRGDIVVVHDGAGGRAVKRIVGLPRERVHLYRGYVFINGRMLREPYLPKYTFTHASLESNKFAFALGSGSYFLLGDNRLNSMDSRNYGPVTRDQIISLVQAPAIAAPDFAPFTLPGPGQSGIRPLKEDPMIASSAETALFN